MNAPEMVVLPNLSFSSTCFQMKVSRIVSMIAACLLISPLAIPQQPLPYKNPDLAVEARVKDLLGRMTPEEKFWQLYMIPGDLSQGEEKYSNGIFGFQVSARDIADAAGQVLAYDMSLHEKALANKINAIQEFFVKETRLGIPLIFFEEALHGLTAGGATVFPQAIGLAATWDTGLMKEVAGAIAHETRQRGIRQVLSPVVNLATDVRWGRVEETYGEDPYLASEMGVAFVKAFERTEIVTTPKHFVANAGEGGRDSYPIHFSRMYLEETHLAPFRACIGKGGSRSIMTAYNSLDGRPCTAHHHLLNRILKNEMRFRGFVISDASATGGANVLHLTAADYPDASAQSINNGLDVIFQTAYEHHHLFIPPFLDGSIPAAVIDSAVARVLRVKFELGLFENPYVNVDVYNADSVYAAHRAIALKAAEKAIVLLKNENQILPLSKSVRKIAVIGSEAVEGRLGGYSGPGNGTVTMLEGIRHHAGPDTEIAFARGCSRNYSEFEVIPNESLRFEETGEIIQGLKAQYFNNIQLDGAPVLERIDENINFRWTLYPPDPSIQYDFFSARWTGKLKAPATGTFRIGMEGNDGYRLYLDGQLIIDNWKKVSYGRRVADFEFERGRDYELKVEFYESSGSVWLKMVWNAGNRPHPEDEIREAVKLAEASDLAIVAVGIEEGEGLDRAYLNLPGLQETLIRRVAETNKPMVVIMVGGSAIKTTSWADLADAILHIWYPGEQGGHAVAGILTGQANPAGRLPITFPLTEGQLPLNYNHKPTGRNDDYGDETGQALYPFGYGLSYTTFRYTDLIFDKKEFAAGDSCQISFTIKNTGEYDGEEVVQLYLRCLLSELARPVKELKGFRRIFLKAGEEKTIRFVIGPEQLQIPGPDYRPLVEPGPYRIMVGASSKDIRLRDVIKVVP